MQLTLSASELLALNNLLYDRLERRVDKPEIEPNDSVHLSSLYDCVKSLIVVSLSDKRLDPTVQNFLNQEQKKIDELKNANEDIKKELIEVLRPQLPEDFMLGNEDYESFDYPRRGPRNRGMNKGGNKR